MGAIIWIWPVRKLHGNVGHQLTRSLLGVQPEQARDNLLLVAVEIDAIGDLECGIERPMDVH